MKKTITSIFIALVLFSCGNNKYEKKILGKWFELKETSKLEFKKDSLTVSDYVVRKCKWNADGKKILFVFEKEFNDSLKKQTIKYRLKNDTLIIVDNGELEFNEFKLIKANNFTEFILKKNSISLNLEENEDSEFIDVENKNGIKIFVEFKNEKIECKSEYSESLENLDNDINKLLLDLSPYIINELENIRTENDTDESSINRWLKVNSYYSLFIDKKVPESKINSIIEKLRKTKIKRIYRIYKTEDNEFVDFNKLKGIKL